MDKLYSEFNKLIKPIKTLIKRFVPQSVQSAAYKFVNKYYFKAPPIQELKTLSTDYNQNKYDDEKLQRAIDETLFDINPNRRDKRIKKENDKKIESEVKDMAFRGFMKSVIVYWTLYYYF